MKKRGGLPRPYLLTWAEGSEPGGSERTENNRKGYFKAETKKGANQKQIIYINIKQHLTTERNLSLTTYIQVLKKPVFLH